MDDKKPLCERKNFAWMITRNDDRWTSKKRGEGDIVEVKRSEELIVGMSTAYGG